VEIIPVIDLVQGQVVRARMGQRQFYQPILSTLCKSSEPFNVLQALLELYPFSTLYIADIDAIQGVGHHENLIKKIAEQFPDIQLWLDCGLKYYHLAMDIANIHLVIGSENIEHLDHYFGISQKLPGKHLLSLDSSGEQTLGPSALHEDPSYWPDRVIGMQLKQVGSGLGANTDLLSRLARLNQLRPIPSALYAAGGVRHIQDCRQLRQQGVAGALVASALHDGDITPQELTAFFSQ
jgi:phosphoribosylformimino-5-aminoimidazole carboxamide ribotide isomerase